MSDRVSPYCADQNQYRENLHQTTSIYDPNPLPHATIRLSNSSLRSINGWYTVHWRPGGGSLVLPLTRSEAHEAKAIRGAHGRETHVVGSTAHGDQRGEGGAGHGGHGGGVAHRGRGGGGGLGARGGGEKEAPFAEVMVVEVNNVEEVAGLETEVQVVTPIMPSQPGRQGPSSATRNSSGSAAH